MAPQLPPQTTIRVEENNQTHSKTVALTEIGADQIAALESGTPKMDKETYQAVVTELCRIYAQHPKSRRNERVQDLASRLANVLAAGTSPPTP